MKVVLGLLILCAISGRVRGARSRGATQREIEALEEWKEDVNFEYIRNLMNPNAPEVTPEYEDPGVVESQIENYLLKYGDPFANAEDWIYD